MRLAYNPVLVVEGILFCMYDPRTNLAGQVRGEVAEHLGGKVFDTSIPRNMRLSESPSHGKPVLLYDLRCVGARATWLWPRSSCSAWIHLHSAAPMAPPPAAAGADSAL